MDTRFPTWFRKTLDKLDFLAIPNLAPLICGMAVLAFLAKTMGSASMDRYIFDPYLVLQGEWWRLFTFPVSSGITEPIWLIFYVLYIYFIINAFEQEWGPGPITIYLILGYLSALAGAFITMQPVEIWYFIMYNVSLAFGTLFPNYELYLFMILPVKAKWLSLLFGVLILFEFLTSGINGKIIIACSLFPYFLFFGPMLVRTLIENYKLKQHKKRFSKDMWR